MSNPGKKPRQVANLVKALQRFSDDGYMLLTCRATNVQAGDYLVTYVLERVDDANQPHKRTVNCECVCATGGEQSSGSSVSRQWIALEGNPKVRSFANDPELLILRLEEVK